MIFFKSPFEFNLIMADDRLFLHLFKNKFYLYYFDIVFLKLELPHQQKYKFFLCSFKLDFLFFLQINNKKYLKIEKINDFFILHFLFMESYS